jgi:hypothetical protein
MMAVDGMMGTEQLLTIRVVRLADSIGGHRYCIM